MAGLGRTIGTGMAIPAAQQRFDIARVAGMALGITGRNFVAFFALAFVTVTLPSALLSEGLIAVPTDGALLQPSTAMTLLPTLVALAGASLLQGIITRAVMGDWSGQPVSIIDAAKSVGPVFLPLVALGVLAGIGVLLALILLIVPGIILWLRWCVAAPVLIVERTGILPAMRRSITLTQSHRWPIFGLAAFYFVASFAIGAIVPMIATALGGDYFVRMIAAALVDTATTVVATVGIATIYFELRQLKDGVDVNKIASVFA